MWSGIEPDVQLFASGRVLDDDGEWAGGQSLGEGSGSGSGSGSGVYFRSLCSKAASLLPRFVL